MSGHVAVIGAGLMGAQIGAEYALAGDEVLLVTQIQQTARAAAARARAALDAMAAHGLTTRAEAGRAKRRIGAGVSITEASRGAWLILESLPERLDLKIGALREAATAEPKAVIATNTSSLSILDIGRGANAAERTIGTHYWNPPTLMPLVEVIPSTDTDPAIVARVVRRLRGMHKEPIVVRDSPGFVWNRLQFALLREAVRLVRDGVATPEAIDTIVERGLARRLSLVGPFTTVALGGSGTFQTIARLLFPEIEKSVAPSALGDIELPSSATAKRKRAARDLGLAALRRQDLATPRKRRLESPGGAHAARPRSG